MGSPSSSSRCVGTLVFSLRVRVHARWKAAQIGSRPRRHAAIYRPPSARLLTLPGCALYCKVIDTTRLAADNDDAFPASHAQGFRRNCDARLPRDRCVARVPVARAQVHGHAPGPHGVLQRRPYDPRLDRRCRRRPAGARARYEARAPRLDLVSVGKRAIGSGG